jgi:hypothetical protein
MGRPVHAAQNRFFAWCDPRLIDQVKIGAAAHQFAVENNPGHFHPGATSAPTRHFRGHPQRHYPFPYEPRGGLRPAMDRGPDSRHSGIRPQVSDPVLPGYVAVRSIY